MTKGFRIALVTAAMTGGIALAGATPASAQVRFRGSFPVPHGRISVGIGDPFFRVGAAVPYGYTVIEDPAYGYGFYYRSRWIPAERFGSSWVVCDQPFFGGRGFIAPRGSFRADGERFDRGRGDRFDRGRFDSRRDTRFERRDFRQDRRDVRQDRRDVRQDRSRQGNREDRRGGRDRDRDGRR